MSTGSSSSPRMSVTLPTCLHPGNLAASTRRQNGSISELHTGSIPNSAPASSNPPLPLNKLPSFISHHPCVRTGLVTRNPRSCFAVILTGLTLVFIFITISSALMLLIALRMYC